MAHLVQILTFLSVTTIFGVSSQMTHKELVLVFENTPQPSVCGNASYCQLPPAALAFRAERFGTCGVAVQTYNNCKSDGCQGADLEKMESWMSKLCFDVDAEAVVDEPSEAADYSPSVVIILVNGFVAMMMT